MKKWLARIPLILTVIYMVLHLIVFPLKINVGFFNTIAGILYYGGTYLLYPLLFLNLVTGIIMLSRKTERKALAISNILMVPIIFIFLRVVSMFV